MIRPNLLHRVSNAAEASYFLLHRWPQAKGPAYQAARNACYLAALDRTNTDDCRRAFAEALTEAGMSNLDEFSESEGVGPTQVIMRAGPAPGQVRRWVHRNPGLAEERIGRIEKKGRVWFGTGTKAGAGSVHPKGLSRDLAQSAVGKALEPMRKQQDGWDRKRASI